MPRKASFNYQIDRRRSKKEKEVDQEEEEYIFEDEESKASETESYVQEEEEEDDDDDDDDDDEDFHSPPSSPKRKQRKSPPKKSPSQKKKASPKRRRVEEWSEEEFQEEESSTFDQEQLESDEKNNDDDDDDDDDFVPASRHQPARRRKASNTSAASIPRRNRRARNTYHSYVDGEDEAEFQDDDDDLIPYNPSPIKPLGRSRKNVKEENKDEEEDDDSDGFAVSKSKAEQKKLGKPPRRISRDKEDNGDNDDEVWDDDEDFDTESKPKAQAPAGRKRGRAPRRVSKEDEDEDEDEEDTKPKSKATKPERPGLPKKVAGGSESEEDFRQKTSTRGKRSRGARHHHEDESEDDAAKPRPTRSTAAEASVRMKVMSFRASSESEEDSDDNKVPMTKKDLSSDEEFLDDSVSEASIEEDQFDSDSEDDNLDNADLSDEEEDYEPSATGNVDAEEVGTAEESSGDENEQSASATRTASKKAEILPFQDVSSSDNDDDQDESDLSRLKTLRFPQCASTEDAITLEPLPKRHVCYICPDGQSRQCFCIETLRQIALKTSRLQIRVDLDGAQRITFLQPPHFRTAMSDDMLDQIASRFGRQALDLHGNFYNRKSSTNTRYADDGDPDYHDIFGDGQVVLDDEEFMGHVQRYMDNQMGSQDIYACPLCYSEMHRRVVKTDRIKPNEDVDDSEDSQTKEKDHEQLPAESVYDPMLVLGYLDHDKFKAASLFCFTKVANLKKHLREDHSVDTRGIQGNDLYLRFKIRAPDGLLQRYLKNSCRFGTFQGDMRRYWNEGNKQSFVYLLHQMQNAEIFLQLMQADDDSIDDDKAEAEEYISVALNFFQSFQDRAQGEWERVSSPFLKATKADLEDFFAEEGSVEGEDETPHFLANRQIMNDENSLPDENDLVHKIQRKYAEPHPSDDEDDNSNGPSFGLNAQAGGGSDVNMEMHSEVSDFSGYYSEIEEEKDEWVSRIQSQRKGRKRSSGTLLDHGDSLPPNGKTPIGKKLIKRKSSQSTPRLSASKTDPSPVIKKRLLIQESDED